MEQGTHMKIREKAWLAALAAVCVIGLGLSASAAAPAADAGGKAAAPAAKADAKAAATPTASAPAATAPAAAAPTSTAAEKMVQIVFTEVTDGEKPVAKDTIEIKLAKPMFDGTPKNIKAAPTLEKYVDKRHDPFAVPEGVTNMALNKPVKSSDMDPIIGEIKNITDGNLEGGDGSYVELGPGRQWVQIDLKEKAAIYALVVWHYHGEGRVYHDVIVQVSDDADFVQGVKTVFNNDYDNSEGMGLGKNLEYIEDFRGRIIDAKGVTGRYVRLYSNGNSSNDQNHYIEVQVYGKPAK
jgi:hypothetical protein